VLNVIKILNTNIYILLMIVSSQNFTQVIGIHENDVTRCTTTRIEKLK